MAGHPPHVVDEHVGLRVRARRKLLGLSQQALADSLGLTFQQVQKYERGANRISGSKLYEISRKLKVSVGYFFEGLPGVDDDFGGDLVADQVTLMMNQTGGPELARMFVEMEPAQRAGLLSVAGSIHHAVTSLRSAA